MQSIYASHGIHKRLLVLCYKTTILIACSPRKVSHFSFKHMAKRLSFAKSNYPKENGRNVLWTDGSKIVIFSGKNSRPFVRKPANSEYKLQFTAKAIKHVGCSIMVWGCFSYVCGLHKLDKNHHGYIGVC